VNETTTSISHREDNDSPSDEEVRAITKAWSEMKPQKPPDTTHIHLTTTWVQTLDKNPPSCPACGHTLRPAGPVYIYACIELEPRRCL
jgi:hypothetical protein